MDRFIRLTTADGNNELLVKASAIECLEEYNCTRDSENNILDEPRKLTSVYWTGGCQQAVLETPSAIMEEMSDREPVVDTISGEFGYVICVTAGRFPFGGSMCEVGDVFKAVFAGNETASVQVFENKGAAHFCTNRNFLSCDIEEGYQTPEFDVAYRETKYDEFVGVMSFIKQRRLRFCGGWYV